MSTRTVRPVTEVIEDVEWMLLGAEGLTSAARRLGYASPAVLERVLDRAGRKDLSIRLRANETPYRQYTTTH